MTDRMTRGQGKSESKKVKLAGEEKVSIGRYCIGNKDKGCRRKESIKKEEETWY